MSTQELSTIEKIKVLLKRKNLKQKEFANQVGISEVCLCYILGGKYDFNKLKKGVMDKIAEILDIPVTELFYGGVLNDYKKN